MENKIDKYLECGICLEIAYPPVTLPCQHTFCKNCILGTAENYSGGRRVRCPNRCKQWANVKYIQNNRNYMLNDIICQLHPELTEKILTESTDDLYEHEYDDQCVGHIELHKLSVILYVFSWMLCFYIQKHVPTFEDVLIWFFTARVFYVCEKKFKGNTALLRTGTNRVIYYLISWLSILFLGGGWILFYNKFGYYQLELIIAYAAGAIARNWAVFDLNVRA